MRYLLAVVIFAGCVTVPLTPEQSAVRVLRKSDPDATCKRIGKVYASGLASFSDEGRENDLRKATAKVGGDTVTLDSIDANMTHYGTAYRCTPALEAAAKP